MADLFNPDFLIETDQYSQTIDSVVLPYLAEREKQVTLPGKGGVPLYCVSYAADAPSAAVLIIHGFTENAYKYSELIHSLLRCGFSVVMYDQRGHGRSGRDPAISDPSVTHVDDFSDYVDDMEIVCRELLAGMPVPHLLLGHSMGGAVAALYLERHPGAFAAAALCSPMIAPNTFGIPVFVAAGLCRVAGFLGRGKRHPFFMKAYSGPEDFNTSCATDPVRFAWYDGIKAAREEFRNCTPTYRWTLESLHVREKILTPGEPEKIACPILLSTAEHDGNVLPGPQQEFVDRVQHGERILVEGARHEIFRSTNDVFFPWWHRIIQFFRNQGDRS